MTPTEETLAHELEEMLAWLRKMRPRLLVLLRKKEAPPRPEGRCRHRPAR